MLTGWQNNQTLSGTVDIDETGRFVAFGSNTAGSTEGLRDNRCPKGGFITDWGMSFLSNSLDALSTNTWTLEVNGLDVADAIITIDDTSGTGYFSVNNFSARIERGETYKVRWNSDSVGNIGIRDYSMAGLLDG